MKIVNLILFIISIGFILIGVYFDFIIEDEISRDKFYGFGTVFLFLITMPIFLYSRRDGKNWEKYILKKDQIKNNKRSKKENEIL